MVELNIKLPDSFFHEEERDGYWVSSEIKELWAVQLDLLNEFDRVCKKYNLKYILDYGTLLGAIRHKGFIPWDDDLDVSMLREDYDVLMRVGPKEFKYPYFLQNHETESGYDGSVVKLRRSDTTFLMTENTNHRTTYNQGIFIDIFVFDNISSNDKHFVKSINMESYAAFLHMYVLSHRPSIKDGLKLPFRTMRFLYYKIRYGSAKDELKKLDMICRQFNDLECDYVANIMFMSSRARHRRCFENIIKVRFENMMLPVPESYDEVLKDCYGDYMIPVRGSSAHTMVMFDTDKSYLRYIDK